jgi:glutathione S-transferase
MSWSSMPQTPPDPRAMRAHEQAQAETQRYAREQQWLAWIGQTLLPYVNGALAAQQQVGYDVDRFTVSGSFCNARVENTDGSWDWVGPLLAHLQPYLQMGYAIAFVGVWRPRAGQPLREEELDLIAIGLAAQRFWGSHPNGYFAVKIRS